MKKRKRIYVKKEKEKNKEELRTQEKYEREPRRRKQRLSLAEHPAHKKRAIIELEEPNLVFSQIQLFLFFNKNIYDFILHVLK
jgi:hypothetical protein